MKILKKIAYAIYFVLLGGWLINIVRKKDEEKEKSASIDFVLKNSYLKVKKKRGNGNKDFYLITEVGNRKVERRISLIEFEAYQNIGIELRGVSTKLKRTKTVSL